MRILKKKIDNKDKQEDSAPDKTKISKNIDQNIDNIKSLLKDCDDMVYREILVGIDNNSRAALICVDGLADKGLLNEHVLGNLMLTSRMAEPTPINIKDELHKMIQEKTLSVTEMKEVETIEQGILAILSGDTLLILDNYEKLIVIGSKGWNMRSVSQPETEMVVRGPKEGFVESIRVNTALVRRRVREHKLKLKAYQIGRRSKTDICVIYIEDIVNKNVLAEVHRRLETIDIDAIGGSGFIEQLVEDDWRSPFPQIQNTERPDVVAAAIYEGRVAIVVDGTPFALLIPATLNSMMQSPEDYYERWVIATFIRTLRYFGAFMSLYAPGLYVAITAYHPQMLPSKLSMTIALNRAGVPFPSVVEAIIMELTLELLREAGVRLPGPIGATIGIVGGLVIGQAAVTAGIVGPIMVVVVALTAIASFAIPSYNMAIALRLYRFVIIFAAAFLGLYGIMLVTLYLIIHLCGLKSFGFPYLTPYTDFVKNFTDLKDTFLRGPLPTMHYRSVFADEGQKQRMRDKRAEDWNKEE